MKRMKNATLVACIMAVCALFVVSLFESAVYLNGSSLELNTDDIRSCEKERAVKGDIGRIYCFYQTEEAVIERHHRRVYSKENEITYRYYFLCDNCGADDIEKMRADKSFRPQEFYVFSFCVGNETEKENLENQCALWNDYMEGRSDEMPVLYHIDGRVSPASFRQDQISRLEKAAHDMGFEDEEISPIIIVNSHVSIVWIYIAVICGVAVIAFVIMAVILLFRKIRNKSGY
ncbi:hypothetical protein [Ruminococcus flavefaciens]|uniref:hypothetical protein n=1 Tax=Ruminococcus flavefaciens TaxID=1265 RepID=UPI000464F87C|nr:hypothetical protein [Ruminococcus flavefaciens]